MSFPSDLGNFLKGEELLWGARSGEEALGRPPTEIDAENTADPADDEGGPDAPRLAYPPAESAEEVQSYKDEELHNLVKVDDGDFRWGVIRRRRFGGFRFGRLL